MIGQLSKEQKKAYRQRLFRHLDGIVCTPVFHVLHKRGVLDRLLELKQTSLTNLCQELEANEGYLNVALRMLASQAWLEYTIEDDEVFLSINSNSPTAFKAADQYKDAVDWLDGSAGFHPKYLEHEAFELLVRNFGKFRNGQYDTPSEEHRSIYQQVEAHIEGALVGPIIVMLGMDGMFHKYFMEASFRADEFHEDAERFTRILDFLSFLGWFDKRGEHYRFTDKGLFYARRSSAYGVTVSYLPTFRRVEELIFGNPLLFKSKVPTAQEIHVDREMNVWGSGGAHSAYFKKIDEIVIELFDRPIDQQPKGILDMGCGNGAFLIHLFEVIEQRTRRGKLLEEHPLFLVGVDYNQAALKVTRANLVKADIWAKVIWGDIADPVKLEADVRESYGIGLSDLLNVRTFLDHNRPWSAPKEEGSDSYGSTGAFVSGGLRLSNAVVVQNLKEHFLAWKPYIQRFGLIVIELHTVPPQIVAEHLGQTAVTAYDATHGFSDQYILELDVFDAALQDIGLLASAKHFSKYPNNQLASVSVNYLKTND